MSIEDRIRLCREATPGPWTVSSDGKGSAVNEVYCECCADSHEDAAFIAAHDPATVARMWELLRRAEGFVGGFSEECAGVWLADLRELEKTP